MYFHHLDATGYIAKKKIWREEERATTEARLPIEYDGFNERTRDYLKVPSQNGYMRGR